MVKDAFNNGQESAVPIPAPGFRKAGVLLLLTAVATLAAVAGRVLADADQPTLLESLSAIAESRLAYGSGGLARVVSGISLAAAAALLWKSVTMRETPPMALALGLLMLSGICTILSGVCSVLAGRVGPGVRRIADCTQCVIGSDRCAAVGLRKGRLRGCGTGLGSCVAAAMASGRRVAAAGSGYCGSRPGNALHLGRCRNAAAQNLRAGLHHLAGSGSGIASNRSVEGYVRRSGQFILACLSDRRHKRRGGRPNEAEMRACIDQWCG